MNRKQLGHSAAATSQPRTKPQDRSVEKSHKSDPGTANHDRDSVLVPELQKKSRPEPVYFNLAVTTTRRLNADTFWDSKQNTDLAKWIRHRRNVEKKIKPKIDNKLPSIFETKLVNDQRYKKQTLRLDEIKRKAANKTLKDRCSAVRGFCDHRNLNADFNKHKRLAQLMSKSVKPVSATPRKVQQELRREMTPPLVRKLALLPPISGRSKLQSVAESEAEDKAASELPKSRRMITIKPKPVDAQTRSTLEKTHVSEKTSSPTEPLGNSLALPLLPAGDSEALTKKPDQQSLHTLKEEDDEKTSDEAMAKDKNDEFYNQKS